MSSLTPSGRSFLALSALLLLTAPSIGCKKPADAAAAAAPPRVRFVHPKQTQVTDYEYFIGTMESVESVEVRARVTGYLQDIFFKDGDEVEKGAELYLIDPRPYKALADQAKAQVLVADARLKLAKADYERGLTVSKTPGAISAQELETFAANVAQAEATVVAAKAAEEAADLNVGYTKINAEISGLISRPLVTRGNLVVQDNTLLTTIKSQDPIYCYFDMDSSTTARFRELIRDHKIRSTRDVGEVKHLQIHTDEDPKDDYPHDGVLDFIENRVSTSSGTLQLRARFANPFTPGTTLRQFAAGERVDVRVPVGPEHPALLVPQAAVGTDQGEKFVFAISKDNKIEYRPIEAGALQPNAMQEIIPRKVVRVGEGMRVAEMGEQGEDSITASDRIVVAGLQRIRQGSVVTPVEYVALQPSMRTNTASIDPAPAPTAPAASPSATKP
ncbi:MAG: hypothetical protein C0483_20400 [Pirellula sp.]|nr:hypothetical protein [Pirellula sp.]